MQYWNNNVQGNGRSPIDYDFHHLTRNINSSPPPVNPELGRDSMFASHLIQPSNNVAFASQMMDHLSFNTPLKSPLMRSDVYDSAYATRSASKFEQLDTPSPIEQISEDTSDLDFLKECVYPSDCPDSDDTEEEYEDPVYLDEIEPEFVLMAEGQKEIEIDQYNYTELRLLSQLSGKPIEHFLKPPTAHDIRCLHAFSNHLRFREGKFNPNLYEPFPKGELQYLLRMYRPDLCETLPPDERLEWYRHNFTENDSSTWPV